VAVKDDAPLGASRFQALDQVSDLRRDGLADGVAYDDVIGAVGAWVGGDADHSLGIGQAFEWTRKCGGDAQLNGPAALLRDPDGIGHRRHAVFGGAADVGFVVGI
jgi:hypothetical protein